MHDPLGLDTIDPDSPTASVEVFSASHAAGARIATTFHDWLRDEVAPVLDAVEPIGNGREQVRAMIAYLLRDVADAIDPPSA